MNIFRVLMCAALVAAPLEIADAQCYVDANGNMVCPTQSSTTVRRGLFGRRVVRTVQQPTRSYSTVYSRTYSQPVQSSGSSANYGAGSSGYSATYTSTPVVTYTSEPAATVAPADKAAGSAGCDCGCAEELEAIRERLDALEAARWQLPSKQTSKAGPAFSFTQQEGPALAFTKPQGVTVASR